MDGFIEWTDSWNEFERRRNLVRRFDDIVGLIYSYNLYMQRVYGKKNCRLLCQWSASDDSLKQERLCYFGATYLLLSAIL